MIDTNIDCIVIGAGPAGLGASIELAKRGGEVLLIDENSKPGGQLCKQIHKFFGSKEHLAGTRGYIIGNMLLDQAKEYGVHVLLDTLVWGVFDDNVVAIDKDDGTYFIQAKKIIIATGAVENSLSFKGCNLPGVITAGAAQTFVNVERVLPGKKILIIGSGNVGLIVGYQLLQAGATVVGVVEYNDKISGYEVHANKLKKAKVPFYLSHTIVEASGEDEVDKAIIKDLNNDKVKMVKCDTICLAVGLTPRIDIPLTLGAKTKLSSTLGGFVPLHSKTQRVSNDLYIAGDVAGVEEASTALEEGKLAGINVSYELGLITNNELTEELNNVYKRLDTLRSGSYGFKRRVAKDLINKEWRLTNE